jgi:hypothetical protein
MPAPTYPQGRQGAAYDNDANDALHSDGGFDRGRSPDVTNGAVVYRMMSVSPEHRETSNYRVAHCCRSSSTDVAFT